jgi:hypothetical protein
MPQLKFELLSTSNVLGANTMKMSGSMTLYNDLLADVYNSSALKPDIFNGLLQLVTAFLVMTLSRSQETMLLVQVLV